MIELTMDLEDEFNINIPENKIAGVTMVEDVVRLLTEWSDGAIDNSY
jgi:acyl carrier protein